MLALHSLLILAVCSLFGTAAASQQLLKQADSTRGLQVAGGANGHQQMRVNRPRTFSSDIQARLAAGRVYDQMVQLPKVEPLSANTTLQINEAMKTAAAAHLAWAPVGMASWGTASSGGAGPSQPMLQVVDCINQKYQRKKMTWAVAMADEPASVEVVGAWWTNKTARVPATLVTQATVDRIPQLYAQCRSWPGPLSVVLYLGLLQNTTANLTQDNKVLVEQAILQVSKFFYQTESNPGRICQPSIMLVTEVYTERKALLLYPINLLRNLARLMARTPLIMLLDVDMLVSSSVYKDLLSPGRAADMVKAAGSKQAFILPAFETYGSYKEAAALADTIAFKDKRFLLNAVGRGLAGYFDQQRFPSGHNATQFQTWYSTGADYLIAYRERYEPWIVVDRQAVPWHDVRFRGYGNNKIQHVAHINASGYSFKVLGNSYIVHRAHKETSVRHRLVASKVAYDTAVALAQPLDNKSVYGHTKALFDGAKAAMDHGAFREVLDPALTNCLQQLPWWQPQSGSAYMHAGNAM